MARKPRFRIGNDGWITPAHHVPSPNFNTRPADTHISLLVIHSISLPPGQFGGPWIDALFTNTLDPAAHPYFQTIAGIKVSSHLLIRRDGSVVQYVPFTERAWHAGASQFQSVTECNDYSIGIELEGLEGDAFEAAQYDSLSALCAALLERLPIDHIAGHEHIALGRKRDPGPGFDWTQLQSSLGLPPHHFPAKT